MKYDLLALRLEIEDTIASQDVEMSMTTLIAIANILHINLQDFKIDDWQTTNDSVT